MAFGKLRGRMAAGSSLYSVARSALRSSSLQLPGLDAGSASLVRTAFALKSTSAKKESKCSGISDKVKQSEIQRELKLASTAHNLLPKDELGIQPEIIGQRQHMTTKVGKQFQSLPTQSEIDTSAALRNKYNAEEKDKTFLSRDRFPLFPSMTSPGHLPGKRVSKSDLYPFFTNCDFWMMAPSDDMRPDIGILCRSLETPVSTSALGEEFDIRGCLASRFMWDVFNAVTRFTDRFTPRCWGNVVGYEPELDMPEEIRKEEIAKFYLDSHFIGDRITWKAVLIGQAHAADALFTEQDMVDAEDYMRIRLKEELACSLTPNLYGAIFIGGRVSVYQMDKLEGVFSRLVNGRPQSVADSKPTAELWKLVCGDGDEGMSELLRIIMECWHEVDPDAVAMKIEQKRKANLQLVGFAPVTDIARDN